MKTFASNASSLTQAGVEQAIEDALGTFSPDDVVATRHHDTSVTNIPGSGSTPVEIRRDNSTAGAAVPSLIKGIHLSCTFGSPIEILSGASAGAAVRKVIANLGEGPLVIPIRISANENLYVRSLETTGVTSGVLTINLLG